MTKIDQKKIILIKIKRKDYKKYYRDKREFIETFIKEKFNYKGPMIFQRSPKGKPYLQVPEGIYFNLTDTDNYILLALTQVCPIGLDMEERNRKVNLKIFKRYCCGGEEECFRTWWKDYREEEMVLAGWSRKEAYGKALGVGIDFSKSFEKYDTTSEELLKTMKTIFDGDLVYTVCLRDESLEGLKIEVEEVKDGPV